MLPYSTIPTHSSSTPVPVYESGESPFIIRAHYLGELKSGIFIAVAGEDKNDAMKNALNVIGDLDDITQAAGLGEVDSCNFREIGSVVILPQ